jgi:Putative DNA-binding domain
MTLLEVQTRMARSIFAPLTLSDRITPGVDADYIKPNNRLTSAERLEIYSRSYWFRILDSLYNDFPGLRAVLGKRAFNVLSRAYLADCPSRSFTLRNLGSRLPEWLELNPQYAGNRYNLALDMVRLEWAHIEAFDNAEEKALGPEDLLELGPEFRVSLQAYIRLLALEYPVDNLRIRVNRASDERGAASNASLKKKHCNAIGSVARLKPQRIFLAVHRLDFMVYYRRLVAEEYLLLEALRKGLPIGHAIPYAFENSPASAEEQGRMLETWFATWAQLQWLCRTSSKRRL